LHRAENGVLIAVVLTCDKTRTDTHMGLLNINTIGAFVFLIVVLAIWRHGPGFKQIEDSLSNTGSIVQILLFGFVASLLAALLFIPDSNKLPYLGWVLHFVKMANLIIHEAGHGLMIFFPRFIMVAGGTLLEVGLPLVLTVAMIVRGYQATAAMCLFWLALSLSSVSHYVGDARARALPLIGGGEHDWYYMLSRVELLEYDQAISRLLYTLAVLSFLGAIYLAIRSIKT